MKIEVQVARAKWLQQWIKRPHNHLQEVACVVGTLPIDKTPTLVDGAVAVDIVKLCVAPEREGLLDIAEGKISAFFSDPEVSEEFCKLDPDILRRQVLGKMAPPPGLFGSEVVGLRGSYGQLIDLGFPEGVQEETAFKCAFHNDGA
eukprot:8456265-Pyramimonas_sp.AAC.1